MSVRVDSLCEDLSLSHGGASLFVTGPYTGPDGEFYYATTWGGSCYRLQEDGRIVPVQPNHSIRRENW